MPQFQYVGISHYREITRDDFKSVGIDHDTLGWDRDNRRDKEGFNQVNDVSDEVARHLENNEPKGDFIQAPSDGPIALPSLVAGGETMVNPQPLTPAVPVETIPESTKRVTDNPQA